jgi:NAD(P)-dependent dehydrogenase (short-subunit alcohol dehydrogenase family)
MDELTGKVAIVTAGANGIGEGSALALARMGADIAIGDVDSEKGEQLVLAIQKLGRRARFFRTDMMVAEEARKLIAQTVEAFEYVDILVNNAGGARPRPFVEQTDRNWQRVIDLNFVSMLAATHAAAPVMRQNGAIINVASTEALRAAPGFSIYASCKAAMVEFTKTMALELASRAIRVNCIAPDLIATPGLAPLMANDKVSADVRNRNVPLGRMASIEEAGNVVAFLASPLASWITGVTIPVDGGITAAAGWHRGPEGEWRLVS